MNRSHLISLVVGTALALPVIFLVWSPGETSKEGRTAAAAPHESSPRETPALATIVGPASDTEDSIWAGLKEREEAARTPLPSSLFEEHPEVFGLDEKEEPSEASSEDDRDGATWLEGKSPSLLAYYQKESVSAEEWARAYEEEMCACSTKECLMTARRDHERHSPPFGDKTTTDDTRKSLRAAQECVVKGLSS